jgi:hypothetical protein
MNDYGVVSSQVVDFNRKAPCFPLTDEERVVLGPLASAFRHNDIVDLLDELYETARSEFYTPNPDPLYRMKTITALWRAYLVLSNAGVLEADQWVVDLDRGLKRIERTARKILLKKIFDAGTSDERASEIIEFLVDNLVNTGRWKDWKKDFSQAARGGR